MTTTQVLTSELIFGLPLDKCTDLDQETRDWIGQRIIELCLREMFEFRFMQSDPNWSNFFYDAQNERIILLDFGATREYSEDFSRKYMYLIRAAADQNLTEILKYSVEIGFLTGYETKMMQDSDRHE